ncbi:MAG: hypothetical protein ACLSHL_01385 [Alistipes communis]
MKKFLKIVAIVAVVFIAVALVVPLALKSKVGDIVKKEASELLTAEVDFRSLDLSLLRHFRTLRSSWRVDGRLRRAVRRGYAGFGRAHLGGRRPDVALRRFGLRGDQTARRQGASACAQTRRRQRELGRDETFGRTGGGEGAGRGGRTVGLPSADARRASVGGRRPL